VARAHGLAPHKPAVLADSSNVLVHLAPAPVVARVATTTALIRPEPREWLAREIDVAGFLASRRAPVVPPSDELPPGPHERDGLFVTFWRFVDHHANRAPEVTEVAGALAYLETRSALPAHDLALVRAAHARVRRALEQDSRPRQALHGDAPPGQELEPFLEARDLQSIVWLGLYAERFPERRGRAEARVRALRDRS
jgi:hypothetical protein